MFHLVQTDPRRWTFRVSKPTLKIHNSSPSKPHSQLALLLLTGSRKEKEVEEHTGRNNP